jgi:hypothetical protein
MLRQLWIGDHDIRFSNNRDLVIFWHMCCIVFGQTCRRDGIPGA